jgi:hypothetical protein
MLRTGLICAGALLSLGVAAASYRTFWYPGVSQELKQESEQRSLHGAPIKIYLDYRHAPALVEVRIHQQPGAPEVRYDELTVKVLDEKGGTIPMWKGWATSDWLLSDMVPGIHVNSGVNPSEPILDAIYYLQVTGARRAASVELEWSGEREKFPLFASNHGFGYRLGE